MSVETESRLGSALPELSAVTVTEAPNLDAKVEYWELRTNDILRSLYIAQQQLALAYRQRAAAEEPPAWARAATAALSHESAESPVSGLIVDSAASIAFRQA